MTLVYHLYGRHFVTWSQEQSKPGLNFQENKLPYLFSTGFIPDFRGQTVMISI